jgi:LPXTG-site transpeptidase (sortase) family protein
MSDSTSLDHHLSGYTTFLTVIAGLLVGLGFLMPSQASDAAPVGYRPMAGPAVPTRLVVPALKIKAPVQPIEVSDAGVLDPPRNPRDVGWWNGSVRPGAQRGQTVLTGHTVHTGGGVMDRLGDLRRGQLVRVVTRKGTMTYRTTRVVTWTKAELAQRASSIFAQKRTDNRLVLITCSQWTGSSYKSNVVVFAQPLGVRERG